MLLSVKNIFHKQRVHYPKDVLIAAVIFAAAVCQWGGNHENARETLSFAAIIAFFTDFIIKSPSK